MLFGAGAEEPVPAEQLDVPRRGDTDDEGADAEAAGGPASQPQGWSTTPAPSSPYT